MKAQSQALSLNAHKHTSSSTRCIITTQYTAIITTEKIFDPRREKTDILVSDQVRHKPGCKATEDG